MRPHQLSSDQAFKTSVHKDRRKEGRKKCKVEQGEKQQWSQQHKSSWALKIESSRLKTTENKSQSRKPWRRESHEVVMATNTRYRRQTRKTAIMKFWGKKEKQTPRVRVDLWTTYSSTKVIQTQGIDDGSNRREKVKIGQLDYTFLHMYSAATAFFTFLAK